MVAFLGGEILESIRNGNGAIRLFKIVDTIKIGVKRNSLPYEELMFAARPFAMRLSLSGPLGTTTEPATVTFAPLKASMLSAYNLYSQLTLP